MMVRLGASIETLRTDRFVRFLIIGGINTLFGFAIYSGAILLGAEVWLALIIGTLAGIVFNFFTVSGYVFRQMSATRFPRFLFCYLVVYLVNLGSIDILLTWVDDKIIAQSILVLPAAVLSYTLLSRLVYRDRATAPPP